MDYIVNEISKKELVKLLPKYNLKNEGKAEELRARLLRALNNQTNDEDLIEVPQSLEQTIVETQIPESSTQSIPTENTEIGIAGSSHLGTNKNIPNDEKKKKSLYNPQLFQYYLTNNPEVKEQ